MLICGYPNLRRFMILLQLDMTFLRIEYWLISVLLYIVSLTSQCRRNSRTFWCAIYSKCRNTERFEILVGMVNKTWHFSEFSITSMNTDSSVSYSTSQCRRNLARSVLVCYISVEIQLPVRMVKSVLDAITLSCQSGLADIENTWIPTEEVK